MSTSDVVWLLCGALLGGSALYTIITIRNAVKESRRRKREFVPRAKPLRRARVTERSVKHTRQSKARVIGPK